MVVAGEAVRDRRPRGPGRVCARCALGVCWVCIGCVLRRTLVAGSGAVSAQVRLPAGEWYSVPTGRAPCGTRALRAQVSEHPIRGADRGLRDRLWRWAVVVVTRLPLITDRDLQVLTFAGEQYGVSGELAEELCARLAPAPLAPGSRETIARRALGRLDNSGFIERLRVGGLGVWAVPTTRGLRMAGLSYERWQPSGWKLRHLEAVSRLRLYLADHEPAASWVSERAIRRRWAGTGARVRIADGALSFPDGDAVGVEVELNVKAAHRYQAVVADQDPDWSSVWWYAPAGDVRRLAAQLAAAGARNFEVVPIPEGVAP